MLCHYQVESRAINKRSKALEEGKYSDCINIWHSRVIVEDKVYGRTVCALAIDA